MKLPPPGPDPRLAELLAGLQALALPASAQQQHQLLAYLDLLLAWNRRINLTAVRDPQRMVALHLLDCLAALPAVDRRCGQAELRVLDAGSGAGLPGVVWSVMRPSWQVCCADAVAKKAGFVRQVAVEVGLPRLRAEHARVEVLAASSFDLIVSRAFTALPDFVALTAHLLAEDGCWLALKGALPDDEIAALPPAIDAFHVEPITVPGLTASRCLVWMRPRTPRQPVGAGGQLQ